VQKRAKYAGGEVARSDSWVGSDGKQWHASLYDIRDLTYEVPDFAPPLTGDMTEDRRTQQLFDTVLDVMRNSAWSPEELAAFLPLAQATGRLDLPLGGMKYSIEKQRQIMEQIRAFTTPSNEAKIVPLGAP
jgi:hypothetical protein